MPTAHPSQLSKKSSSRISFSSLFCHSHYSLVLTPRYLNSRRRKDHHPLKREIHLHKSTQKPCPLPIHLNSILRISNGLPPRIQCRRFCNLGRKLKQRSKAFSTMHKATTSRNQTFSHESQCQEVLDRLKLSVQFVFFDFCPKSKSFADFSTVVFDCRLIIQLELSI